MRRRKLGFGIGMLALCGWAGAQELSIDKALQLAKANNGTLKSAILDIQAAKARTSQARAAFFPTLSPRVSYIRSRNDVGSASTGNLTVDFEQRATQVAVNWRILDSGERLSSLRASRESELAQAGNSRQSIRQVLFGVHQQYIETLRAQELEELSAVQLKRAQTVLDQTKARVEVGDVAPREILQAQADALNASVTVISARNRSETSAASLKAQIGLQQSFDRPKLSPYEAAIDSPSELGKAVEVGLSLRPDLIAQRRSLGASQQSLKLAQIGAGVAWSLDYGDTTNFTPTSGSNQQLSFIISYPLFDGGLSRSVVSERKAGFLSASASLGQAERVARSEIESAFITFTQNESRVSAASKAYDAAKLNFEATQESRRLGASDLIDVLTAQVSLATAEGNFIEAKYDRLISQLRLQLVTGMPIPGEDN